MSVCLQAPCRYKDLPWFARKVFHTNTHKAEASQQSFEVGTKGKTQSCYLSSFATKIPRLLANQGAFSSEAPWPLMERDFRLSLRSSAWLSEGSRIPLMLTWVVSKNQMDWWLHWRCTAILTNMLELLMIHCENLNSSSIIVMVMWWWYKVVYWAITERVQRQKWWWNLQ